MLQETYRKSVLKASLALSTWMLVHSAFASVRAKEFARRYLGERRTNALYRLGYNALALGSFGVVGVYIWRLPDRRLYSATGLTRKLMFGGQAASGLAVLVSALQVGPIAFSGLRSALDLLLGRPITPSAVVQHPLPEPGAADLGWTGPYRLSRHPLNYFVLLAYWLSPVMTVKWAALGGVTAVYMVLGSKHEGHRLLLTYGDRYRRYRQEAPHFLIHLGRR